MPHHSNRQMRTEDACLITVQSLDRLVDSTAINRAELMLFVGEHDLFGVMKVIL
jgi:hypothetical protein